MWLNKEHPHSVKTYLVNSGIVPPTPILQIFFHINYRKRENTRLNVNIRTNGAVSEIEILKPVIKANKLVMSRASTHLPSILLF